jgi:hypothetical protein
MTAEDLTAKLTGACGPSLRSVVLYGSTVAGDYNEPRSNHNILVVLDRLTVLELKAIAGICGDWIRAGNPAPILFSHEQLLRSADVFPIEIADIKDSHRILFGEDVVASLPVYVENLRWQLESELKEKLIALRERYLLTGGTPARVTELLIDSLSPFLALFRGALRLFQTDVPPRKMDALEALARHVPIDTRPFDTVSRLKQGTRMRGLDPDQLFADYLRATEQIIDAVDQLLHGPARATAERGITAGERGGEGKPRKEWTS